VAKAYAGEPTKRHTLVIGNPGIGKTWSLNFLLWRALQVPAPGFPTPPIVLLRATLGWFAFVKGKCWQFDSYPGKAWIVQQGASDQKPALVLHDIDARDGVKFETGFDYGPVRFVWASSPNENHYKGKIVNAHAPLKFYMPLLTKGEFLAVATKLHPEQEKKKAAAYFAKFGGVIRHAFTEEKERAFRSALDTFNFSTVSISDLGLHQHNELVQLVPTGDTNSGVRCEWVSEWVREQFDNRHASAVMKTDDAQLSSLLMTQMRDSTSLGRVFEDYCLRHAHKFDWTQTIECKQQKEPINNVFVNLKPPADFVKTNPDEFCATLDDHLRLDKRGPKVTKWLDVPNRWNFPVLDGILLYEGKAWGLQLTIQKTPKKPPTEKTLKHLETEGVPLSKLSGIIFVTDTNAPNPSSLPRESGTAAAVKEWNMLPMYWLRVSCEEHRTYTVTKTGSDAQGGQKVDEK
jgi:hypothetical protein